MRSKKASGSRYAPYARAAWSAAKTGYNIYNRVRQRLRNRQTRTRQKRVRRKKYGMSMGSSIPGRCSVLVRRGGKSKFIRNLTKYSPPRLIASQGSGVLNASVNQQNNAMVITVFTNFDFNNMKSTLPALGDTGPGTGQFITSGYFMDIAIQKLSAEILLTNTSNAVAFVTLRTFLCKKDSNSGPLDRWTQILGVENANTATPNVLTTTYGAHPWQVDGFSSWWKCIKTKKLRLGPGEIHCHNHVQSVNRVIRGATYEGASTYIKGWTQVYTMTVHGEPTQTNDTGTPVLSPSSITWAWKEEYKYTSVTQNIPQIYQGSVLPASGEQINIMTQLNSLKQAFTEA